MQRAVGSPGSGSDGQAISDDLAGITHQEALVMLSVKIKETNELKDKVAENEQMIHDRDAEIEELMTDNDKMQLEKDTQGSRPLTVGGVPQI